MNDMLKLIENRFSCRAFLPNALTDEQLRAVTEAGAQAPSAVNAQPWRIIAVKDAALIAEMDDHGLEGLAAMPDKAMYERIISRGGKLFYNAPCIIVVPVDAQNPAAPLDCGIVCENMALAAAALGLGSCICGLARFSFAGEKGAEFAKRIGIPEGYTFGMSVLVGTPAAPGTPHQPDYSKISVIV